MIDPTELRFGNQIFKINKITNWNSNKIYMTDADGVEWYRYDKEKVTFEIECLTYCGKRFVIEAGECRADTDISEVEYFFKNVKGEIEPYYTSDFEVNTFNPDEYFYTHFEAQRKVNELNEKLR
jgi:hypothetical protein